MPLNTDLFVQFNYFQEYFVDKQTGLPLAGGVVYWWQDINRNNPKPVYELSGSPPNYTYTELENPIILTNAGTFADTNGNDIAVYGYPYDAAGNPDNYYVSVFAAPFNPPYPPVGTPIITRENIPGVTTGIGPGEVGPLNNDNAFVNSQFVQVLFNPTLGLTIPYNAGVTTTQIAPGWYIQTTASGSGTVTVTRTSLAGNTNFATNPPYSLSIDSRGAGGLSRVVLLQRLQNNPNIYAGGFLNVGLALAPNTQPITVYYAPQGLITLPEIATFSNTSGIWVYQNSTTIDALAPGTNTNTADTGYVDIEFWLTPNTLTTVSSAQLVFLGENSGTEPVTNVPYNQPPVINQISGNSFYYDPLYAYKPIPSYLVGWDFPLNPAQFGETQAVKATANNTGNYFWDQTIVYQTLTNGVSGVRGTNGSLQLTSNGTGQIALIQYLDQATARKILSDRASVHMSLYKSAGWADATGNVTLWATTDANLPALPTTFISTLAADGKPATVSSVNWTQVPNVYNNTQFTVPVVSTTNSESIDINLNGWDMAAAVPTNTATFFAIVVGFTEWDSADILNVNSISLCAGDIATRPSPLTSNQTLDLCERYYEMSYQLPADVGMATFVNSLSFMQDVSAPSAGDSVTRVNSFSFNYRNIKRVIAPNLTLYSTISGTSGVVNLHKLGDLSTNQDLALTNWTLTKGNKGNTYIVNLNSGITFAQAGTLPGTADISFQYVSDARLGVVN